MIRLGNGKRKARMRGDGKYVHLGTFPDPVEAAHAYDEAARHHLGEKAKTDFPIRDKVRGPDRDELRMSRITVGQTGT